jgi:hypothetical protein
VSLWKAASYAIATRLSFVTIRHPDRPGHTSARHAIIGNPSTPLNRKSASLRPGSSLLWQAELADQILEAGIGVQKVEFGVRFDCNRKVLLVLVEALL